MKKCPYCAEEIMDEAIVCKHCKSSLVKEDDKSKKTKNSILEKKVSNKKILKVIGYIILFLISISLWYIAIPIFALWYIWKKSKIQTKKKKLTYSGITLLVSCVVWIVLGITSAQANKAPTITLSEPNDNQSIQADNILVKGSISPVHAVLTINNKTIDSKDGSGNFTYKQPLTEEKNVITIKAVNKDKVDTKVLTINRIFTDEEIAERERIKAEAEAKKQAQIEAQKKAEEERLAKEKAEQEAWDASKAGKLCKKHPE